jgi:hypothetical protein
MLLFVLALSAILAITLYQQLPRAAFEAQREKESLLINHGEQYKRAIQLYVRKMGRYPAKMEDLDNTQNIRFLRKHYIDPMTGKDEWRLLHMGPNGKLIDSKIKKQDPNQDQWHQGSITEFKSAAASDADDTGPQAVNLAARHRASDDLTLAPMGGPPPADPAALALANANNSNPTNQGTLTAGNTAPQGAAPTAAPTNGATGPNQQAGAQRPNWLNGGSLPGMPPGMRNLTLPNGAPTTAPNSGGSVSGNGGYSASVSGNGGYGNVGPSPTPTTPTQSAGGYGGFGSAVNSQYQGQSPSNGSSFGPAPAGQNGFVNSPYSTAQGSNSNFSTGFGNPGNSTSPTQMINNLLTSPRPGGAPTTGSGMPGIGGTVVGGLAGVASTFRGKGIKHYNEQDEYQKWEFFYDFTAEQTAATAAAMGTQPTQNNVNGSNVGVGPGTSSNFGGTTTSFGNNPFSGGVGNSPTPTAPPPPPPQPTQ